MVATIVEVTLTLVTELMLQLCQHRVQAALVAFWVRPATIQAARGIGVIASIVQKQRRRSVHENLSITRALMALPTLLGLFLVLLATMQRIIQVKQLIDDGRLEPLGLLLLLCKLFVLHFQLPLSEAYLPFELVARSPMVRLRTMQVSSDLSCFSARLARYAKLLLNFMLTAVYFLL